MKSIYIIIPGGIGKNIAFTAVLPLLREKYNKHLLYVGTGYPEIYENNPYIDEVIHVENEKVYCNKIIDSEVIICEPYYNSDFFKQKFHLIQAYCEFLGLPYSSDLKPMLFPSLDAILEAKSIIEQAKRTTNKKIVLLQYAGSDPLNLNLKRSIPFYIIQKFVDTLKDEVSFIHIGNKDIRIPFDTFSLNTELKVVLALPKYAPFVGIDSFLQHAAAAYNESKGIVFWAATNPINYGYNKFYNFTVQDQCKLKHCNRPRFVIDDSFKCQYQAKCINLNPDYLVEIFLKHI